MKLVTYYFSKPFAISVHCTCCGKLLFGYEETGRAFNYKGWLECQRENQGVRVRSKGT